MRASVLRVDKVLADRRDDRGRDFKRLIARKTKAYQAAIWGQNKNNGRWNRGIGSRDNWHKLDERQNGTRINR